MLFPRFFFTCAFFLIAINVRSQQKRYSFTEPKMGSPLTIVLYSDDSVRAVKLSGECFKLVDSFNMVFSDYIDSSELGKLNASAVPGARPVAISPALYDLLMLSRIAFENSGGAFDITIGPLVKLWRRSRKTGKFPERQQINEARALTGFNNLVVDTVNKTVLLSKPGMMLDFGGIAQGYIAQKIIDLLHDRHADEVLVNVSGDIVVNKPPPGLQAWKVGINLPESGDELISRTLQLQHKAVTTSGDVYQYMEYGGKRYSHIIDPRTGYGVTFRRNVTVIANDGTTADWLATACSILPVRKARRLAVKFKAELLIARVKKRRLVFTTTRGFKDYWKQPGQ